LIIPSSPPPPPRETARVKKFNEEAVKLAEEARALQEKMDSADKVMSFEAKATTRKK
jgi:hypothetical protein